MRANLAWLLWDAAEAPDRPAIIEPGRTATYGALRARAAGIARSLITSGVQAGDRVALLLSRGSDAVAALAAAHATGAIGVILNDRLRPGQLEQLIGRVQARVILTHAAALEQLTRPIDTGAQLLDVASLPATGDCVPLDVGPRDHAQIIFTSGSVGLPKGVVYSHQALQDGVRIVRGYLGLTADDRIASLLPFSSVYGLNQVLCALASRAAIVVDGARMMNDTAAALRAAGTTVLAAVPPLWTQLLQAPAFTSPPIESLRIIQNAGGHLPAAQVARLRALLPRARLFLQYGQTETFRGAFLPPDEVDAHPGSMGRAMPETTLRVVREDGSIAGDDETGELVHEGPTIAEGYWDDEEATRAVFRPNPFGGAPRVVYSGDMVRRSADGLLTFVGRRDRLIKTMGYRVGPDEVADVLHRSGQVAESAVVGEPDPMRGERIVAHVVLSAQGSLEALSKFCRAELPPYMVPARFEVRDSLPRLVSGKIDIAGLGG